MPYTYLKRRKEATSLPSSNIEVAISAMNPDAGSSLARRRHRVSSPSLFFSFLFASFFDFLQVCLLNLGFFSSFVILGCASCRRCHLQVSWLLFLTCSPSPFGTAAILSDLTVDYCACTAISRALSNVQLSDLCLPSFSWAFNSLPKGIIYSYLSYGERSFLIGVSRDSSVRSKSLSCSELHFSIFTVNLCLSEVLNIHLLLPTLPFTTTKPGVCSHFHSKTDSGDKQLNFGSINSLWLRYGNIGVGSLFLGVGAASPPHLVKLFCCSAGVKMLQVCRLLAISRSRQCSVSAPNPSLLKIGYSGVSADDAFFAFGLLFPVVYRSISGCVDWLSITSCFDIPTTPLCNDILMGLASFGSSLGTSSNTYIALARYSAICSSITSSILDVGVVFGYLSSWWQVEEKLNVIFSSMIMDVAGYVFSLIPRFNQSHLLIFPPIWSELDVHASLVLQGSPSRRMLFSAYGAVCVVLWVTLDAIFEEAYDVVLIQSHMVAFYDLYRHSILYVIVLIGVYLAVNSLLVSSSNGV